MNGSAIEGELWNVHDPSKFRLKGMDFDEGGIKEFPEARQYQLDTQASDEMFLYLCGKPPSLTQTYGSYQR